MDLEGILEIQHLTLLDGHAIYLLPTTLALYIVLQTTMLYSMNNWSYPRGCSFVESSPIISYVNFGSSFFFTVQGIKEIISIYSIWSRKPNFHDHSLVKIKLCFLLVNFIAGTSHVAWQFKVDSICYDALG